MQVFTTIYLAGKLEATNERVQKTDAPDRSDLTGLENFPRECIVTLESRNWFTDDGTDS